MKNFNIDEMANFDVFYSDLAKTLKSEYGMTSFGTASEEQNTAHLVFLDSFATVLLANLIIKLTNLVENSKTIDDSLGEFALHSLRRLEGKQNSLLMYNAWKILPKTVFNKLIFLIVLQIKYWDSQAHNAGKTTADQDFLRQTNSDVVQAAYDFIENDIHIDQFIQDLSVEKLIDLLAVQIKNLADKQNMGLFKG